MDNIAKNNDEEVIIQTGNIIYKTQYAKKFTFLPDEEFTKLYTSTNLVISHAGIGSIITALRNNKPFIIVPRMKKYGEHLDDHQLEIAGEIEKEGIATVVYDVKNLEKLIKSRKIYTGIGFNKEKTILIENLGRYLIELKNELNIRG
ncbi:unnamed protein product [marine sediment metagenome]|uniref:Glycosyl transferase family 28 C-terminal domain-containing protein n=1 Tax=marine sediment metagenome TaxID=412755 RepID=X0ZL68_9ZZZZ